MASVAYMGFHPIEKRTGHVNIVPSILGFGFT